ncbi:uncharacterized protein LOC128993804 [Macrosteles quadrilineatus]|uniref:uncharacterized protein LOC128993804 n=1 Tax=Macrosteles quadrilineatus TaxID=74068 RepID=UPI0023E135F3|nr:uncharacterized protein LOC128993804 [Macrosteles quadrilineatus]
MSHLVGSRPLELITVSVCHLYWRVSYCTRSQLLFLVQFLLYKMIQARQFCCLLSVLLFGNVASEWMELPMMSPTKILTTQSPNKVNMASFQTATQISTEMQEIVDTTSPEDFSNETGQIKITKNSFKIVPSNEKYQSHGVDGFSDFTNYNNKSYTSDQSNISDDMFVIEQTIKETQHNFVVKPTKGNIEEKLNNLKQLKHKLQSQLEWNIKNLWIDRQARGKKLMTFPSLEGALMTIAFLTFAVFLIKLVMQFIQGLQNAEQTILMTLASTPAPVRLSQRPKRAAQNLAAAQILKYIDEFSIKHRFDCDFQ